MARITVACSVLLLFTATAAWAGSSSNAQATPGLLAVAAGPHGYFEYTLSPGAATSGKVLVRDLTASAARYRVYVAGASTSPVTSVAYGQPQASPHDSSAWVKLAAGSVKLSGRGSAVVSFTVSVPRATAPGDYVAAVAAQPPTPPATSSASSTTRGGARLITTTRVIIAVVIHVPGRRAPAANFKAPSVTLQQQRRQVLTIPIDDTGNELMQPYLAGSLRRCTGTRPVLRLHRQLDTFVPHTSIDYPWYLNDQVLSAGCYRVTLTLDQQVAGRRLASYTGTLQVGVPATRIRPPSQRVPGTHPGLPGWLIAALAAAILLLLLAALLLLRARRERRRLLKRLAEEAT